MMSLTCPVHDGLYDDSHKYKLTLTIYPCNSYATEGSYEQNNPTS